LLGLTPDLGSKKMTYGQYLKKTNQIDSNSVSLEYDIDSKIRSNKSQGNITFGKFNSSLPQCSIELVTANYGKAGNFIKSSGFQFANVSFNFPAKSYAQLDPFTDSTGYVTESEQRYTATKDAFADVLKRLTVEDTHKFTW
jgi:hypothetical protein